MTDIDNLNKTIQRQQHQIELLRNKFFALQEAVIQQNEDEISKIPRKLSPIEVEDRGGKITILAFAGMLTSLAMPKAEFFKSLSGNKDVNIVFLKDFKQAWYQCGLLGLTKDIIETADFLKKSLPITTEKIVTLGTSSGGFAAILFGCLLGAQESISFAPQTFLNKREFMRFRSIDSRWSEFQESRFLDLKNIIEEADTIHHIYVGKDNEVDMLHASNISHSKHVVLYPLESSSHNVAKTLKDTGQLDSILKLLMRMEINSTLIS